MIMNNKNTFLKKEDIESFIHDSKVNESVDKKIKLLIAEEELRIKRDQERHIRLEKVKNENFKKKLEKVKAEIEYQEYLRKLKEREIYLLKVESDKVEAQDKMLEEIKNSTLEELKKQNKRNLHTSNIDVFLKDDHFDLDLEKQKEELIRNIESKKQKLKDKEDEITRLVNITNLKDEE